MSRPEGYDPSLFGMFMHKSSLFREGNETARWSCEAMLNYGKLPNNK
ncbi:MAG: hypothetical protein U5L72_05880 [Bacteroidales bacterium]|nr:hypothetical protein [Bacteroidales bacterium]